MRYVLASLMVCGLVPRCLAHPVPAAQVLVEIDDDSYVITVQTDVAALIMAETPGHLGADKTNELGELKEEQVRDRIEDVRQGFAGRLKVAFDGQQSTPEEVRFPEPSEVRQNARAHNSEDATCRIRVRGRMPSNAHTISLTFAEDIGPVRLIVRRGTERLHTQRLEPGQSSGPLTLTEPPTPPREHEPASLVPVAIACGVVGVLFFLAMMVLRWNSSR